MNHPTMVRFFQSSKYPRYALPFLILALILTGLMPSIVHSASIKNGDLAPGFAIEDMAGTMRTLNEHLGKDVVMLDFWSIYCVSCIQAIPKLVDLYEKYKDRGFIIYGIDLDTFSPRRVHRFIKGLQFEITYPLMIDQKREIAAAYKVGMLPTTIVIGKDGKVKLFHIGYKPGDEDEFDRLINKLVN